MFQKVVLLVVKGQSPSCMKRCYPKFSPEDSDLAKRSWLLMREGYAKATTSKLVNGVRRFVSLFAHREVLKRIVKNPPSRFDIADHINGNRLDCRRENIRLTNPLGNSQHVHLTRKNPRGTTFNKRVRKWQAAVGYRNQVIYCGLFDTAEEAGAAAALKRKELKFLE